MIVRATLPALGLACLLAGCASPDQNRSSGPYIGGSVGHLAADQDDCRKQAQSIDYRSADGYSDSRYGATAAMAAAVAEDNPERDMGRRTVEAAFESCMSAKGWKRPSSDQ